MAVNAFQSNQGTQTSILTDNTGGTAGTVIPVMKVSMDAQGTYTDANLFQGTIKAINTLGTLPNLPGGTLNSISAIGTIGTIGLGTVAISNSPTVNVASGSINGTVNIGNTVNVGTMGTLGLGSIVVNSLPNIPGGTIGSVVGVGAIPNVPGGTIGSVVGLGAMPNIPGGTLGSVIGIGSINGLSNLPQGSINVTAGTFRQDPRSIKNILSYGTQVTGTAAFAATIVGSASVGAGTSLWLQDVSVTNNNANALCTLGFGTAQQGTNVLLRATLGTSGAIGIEKSFANPVNAGMTNQDLVFSMNGSGTVDLSISYFISA